MTFIKSRRSGVPKNGFFQHELPCWLDIIPHRNTFYSFFSSWSFTKNTWVFLFVWQYRKPLRKKKKKKQWWLSCDVISKATQRWMHNKRLFSSIWRNPIGKGKAECLRKVMVFFVLYRWPSQQWPLELLQWNESAWLWRNVGQFLSYSAV